MSESSQSGEANGPRRKSLAATERKVRLDMVAGFERAGHFTNMACKLAGVPRAWFYKWKARAGDVGLASCEDRREMSPADREWIRKLLVAGKTQAEVAAEVQRCRATVRKVERALGLRQASRRSGGGDPDRSALGTSSSSNAECAPAPAKTSSAGSGPDGPNTVGPEPNSGHAPLHRDPEQLTGPAGEHQRTITLGKGPFVFLFHGPPGVGKTALCEIFALRLVKPQEFEMLSGKDCGLDKMRELRISMGNPPMFTQWRVVVIEDLDRMPLAAQDHFREMLYKPPSYCAIFASTNMGSSAFEERFWSRFECFPVEGPTEKEIIALIAHLVPKKKAKEIVKHFPGNARAAIFEARAWARLNPLQGHVPVESPIPELSP